MLLLFRFASVYLLVVMSIGLFISSVSSTQIQVMFLVFFFMITFLLMAGIFTPAESMPHLAQQINTINPLYYFIRVIRMILLKGSGFADITRELPALAIYGVVMLGRVILPVHQDDVFRNELENFGLGQDDVAVHDHRLAARFEQVVDAPVMRGVHGPSPFLLHAPLGLAVAQVP